MSISFVPSDSEEDDTTVQNKQIIADVGTPIGNKILVSIRFESIYADSLTEVTLTSSKSFSATFDGKIAHIALGELTDGVIKSVQKDGSHRILFNTIGWLQETSVESATDNGPHASYGMRWFPFISSFMQCNIRVDLPISCIVLDSPDAFRLIWYKAHIEDPTGSKADLLHSYAPDRSKFVFLLNDNSTSGEYRISCQIRLGGMFLFKAINIPMYYGMLTLIGTAAASFQSKSLALGAVVAAWLFLLRQWSSLGIPQRNIFLTRIYQVSGAAIALWTLMWVYFGWTGLSCIIAFMLAGYRIRQILSEFSNTGRLPTHWERYWSRSVRAADSFQKRSLLEEGQKVPQLLNDSTQKIEMERA